VTGVTSHSDPTAPRSAAPPGGAGAGARSPRPQRGERIELRVETIAQGGAGIARREGYVVFVEGAFPGDLVTAEVTKAKRDYANARAVEVLEPSPDRVAVRCDHEGEGCPGSPWQALRYEVQVEQKQRLVAEALERLGRLEGFELEPIVPATEIWRYRNKLEYSFGAREDDGSLVLGFHARGRWDRIEDARDCMLASERNNAARNFVRDWCRAEGLSTYDRRGGDGFLRNLVVREGRRTGDLQLRLVTSPGDFRSEALRDAVTDALGPVGLQWTRAAGVAETTRGGTTDLLAGTEQIEEELCGLRFGISPEAFFQTNTEMAEQLYGIARDYAGLTGQERVFDLYCGIGTLSLVMALKAGEVWGVDIVEDAVADAAGNAALNEIDNAQFVVGDVRNTLRPLAEHAPRPDLVVVDPPRAGLSKKIVARVVEQHARRIVYVSCNPTTLAPDARQMVDAGYRLVKVRPVDMFPHTPHIECVALFERVMPSAGKPADGSAEGPGTGKPADGSAEGPGTGKPADGSAEGPVAGA
jgi:23S rRNA (uracil1939-C5)-methyltransferase